MFVVNYFNYQIRKIGLNWKKEKVFNKCLHTSDFYFRFLVSLNNFFFFFGIVTNFITNVLVQWHFDASDDDLFLFLFFFFFVFLKLAIEKRKHLNKY